MYSGHVIKLSYVEIENVFLIKSVKLLYGELIKLSFLWFECYKVI